MMARSQEANTKKPDKSESTLLYLLSFIRPEYYEQIIDIKTVLSHMNAMQHDGKKYYRLFSLEIIEIT